MRIGLNLLFLLPGVVGGTEVYAQGLLRALARGNNEDEFIVFVNGESAGWPLPAQPNFQRIVCPIRARSRFRRYLFEQLLLPRLLTTHRVDLVHSLGYVSPLFSSCPSVVTIPDLNYRAFGNAMPHSRRVVLSTMVKASARLATRIITISEFSKQELLKTFALPSDKVHVTYLAPSITTSGQPDSTEYRKRLGITGPYILAFSSPTPNKNLLRLLEAYRLAIDHHGLSHQLVLVGHIPKSLRHLIVAAATPHIIATGYVDDHWRDALVSSADALVHPSFYEGFGLPIVEAMSAGVPVACSRIAALPEIAGNAALLFDPFSVHDIAITISRLARDTNLRRHLSEMGLNNVRRFSWDATASRTAHVYRTVLQH